MKSDIHPEMHMVAKVTCTSCKAVFTIPSTVKEQQIEICSNCHPVYTGKYRGIISSGRVERFHKKMAAKSSDTTSKPKRRRLTEDEKFELKAKEATAKLKEKKELEATKKKEKAVVAAKKTIKKVAKKVAKVEKDTKVKKVAKKSTKKKK